MYDFEFDEACQSLCDTLKKVLINAPKKYKSGIQEIRIRLQKPVTVTTLSGIFYVTKSSNLVSEKTENLLTATQKDIDDTIIKICDYSVHAHQHEIKDGFVTLKGGHRAGLCGTAVITGGIVSSLRDISSLNIRIAASRHGCSSEIFNILKNSRGGVLLSGPPLCGKTTILRDLASKLSQKQKVCVVDERSEIGALYNGAEQTNLGVNCDVLNGYPKIVGIVHAVRGMSPKYIIIDEIGTEREAQTIKWGLNSGVSFIATIHAGDINDLIKRREAMSLLESGAFEHIVFLDTGENVGKIKKVHKVSDVFNEDALRGDSDFCGDGYGVYSIT